MIIMYSKKGYPIIRLSKGATDMVVFECLECHNRKAYGK